mgnify:FL=1
MDTGTSIRECIWDANEDALVADGFDSALIGFVEGCGRTTVALYDRNKCIDILINRDGMDYEEAVEFFDFNVVGAYVGDNTPLFATILKDLKQIYPCS